MIVSDDQTHVVIKHKNDQYRYDIFKGFDSLEFFGSGKESKGHLLRDHTEYVATLKVSQRSKQIQFSPDKQFCATFSSVGFQLFDLRLVSQLTQDHGSAAILEQKRKPVKPSLVMGRQYLVVFFYYFPN